MSGPLVFISHSRVKPGKYEEYREHLAEASRFVDEEEPQIIGFNSYESEDGTHVATVQIHPDADSLDQHFEFFFTKLAAKAFETLESYELTVYGQPSENALGQLRQLPGVRLQVFGVHESGFLRTAAPSDQEGCPPGIGTSGSYGLPKVSPAAK